MSGKKAAYILDGDIKIPINDPSVPEWAKSEEKPQYTAEEVGAVVETTVTSEITNAGWYTIAVSERHVNNCLGQFKFVGKGTGAHSILNAGIATSYGYDSSINIYQNSFFHKNPAIYELRLVTPNTYNSNYAYVEARVVPYKEKPILLTVTLSNNYGWQLLDPALSTIDDNATDITITSIDATTDTIPVSRGGTGANDAVLARANLSAVGFVKGEFSSLEAFWDAVTASGNYNSVLCVNVRFKDTTGWCPLGTANIWYQGIVSWQNNPNHETYDTAGVCILWRGSSSPTTLYRGSINGNFTQGVTANWFQVYDSAVNVPIESGGTGADTAEKARTNLGLNPVSLYSGNLSTGSINFEYGKYNFYLITAKISTVARSTLLVPASQIATSALAWQLGIGTNGAYLPLSLVHDNTNVTLEITESGKGAVTQVWGFN